MREDPRALLQALETRARKRFGQHFLTETDVVARIVRGARVEPGDRVVEVGPGLGILTRALLAAGAHVTAIELDRDLAAHLRETLPDVVLVEGDAARVDWDALVEPGCKMVANLPYNVGTTVLMQVLRSGRFHSVTVMLQKEVVDRLMAAPGNRSYGALTVEAGLRAAPVYVTTVEPGSFHPPPKVRSAVVRFDVHAGGPATGGLPADAVDRVVRAAFAQRRKTLANSMAALYGKERVEGCLAELGLDPRVRAEALAPASFVALAAALANASGSH